MGGAPPQGCGCLPPAGSGLSGQTNRPHNRIVRQVPVYLDSAILSMYYMHVTLSIEVTYAICYNPDKVGAEEPIMADTFYTPEELAAMLKVTRQAIYNWIQQGRMEAVRIGRTVRIPREEVERLLREGRSRRQTDGATGEQV